MSPVETRTPPARRGLLSNPSGVMIGLLIGVRVLIAGLDLGHTGGLSDDVDVRRFVQIVDTPGRAYRDFPVEYMPLELIAIHGLVGGSLDGTFQRVVALSLLCDLLAFAGIWYGWGKRPAALYLVFGLPLLTFLYFRFDPVAVAMAVWGFALARRGRDDSGGAVLAAAALTKLWPIALLPALAIERRWRAGAWAAGVLILGGALWIAYGGVDAIHQVATFRGATGWEVESTIGDLVWIVTGGPIRLEAGSTRVGVIPGWARAGLSLLLVAAIVAVWRVAARRWPAGDGPLGPGSLGGPALAALGALLALSPLFSIQYAAWIVPWAALAATSTDRKIARYGFGAVLLTGVIAMELVSLEGSPSAWEFSVAQSVILVRNAICLALPLIYLRSTSPRAAPVDAGMPGGQSAG